MGKTDKNNIPKDGFFSKIYRYSVSHPLNEGMWWLMRGCGGSMVVHQAVKPAVPGSNPASLQPTGTCHSLLGSQQGWHETAGWPLRGGRGKKK